MTKHEQRVEYLIERGAKHERREDEWGDTKTGWWMDGVWLGVTERDAVERLRG